MGTQPAPQDPHAPLWVSENPRFGTVRRAVIEGPYAAKLDDLNSDYREITLTVLKRNPSGWETITVTDDAGYPGLNETAGHGWSNGYAFVVGHEHPGTRISVRLGEERHMVKADSDGWWLFVGEYWPPHEDALLPEFHLRWSVEENRD